MASHISAILETVALEYMQTILDHFPDLIDNMKNSNLIDPETLRSILQVDGMQKEKALHIWGIVSETVLSDWKMFWTLIGILYATSMPEVAEALLPSHYHPDSATSVVDDSWHGRNTQEGSFALVNRR